MNNRWTQQQSATGQGRGRGRGCGMGQGRGGQAFNGCRGRGFGQGAWQEEFQDNCVGPQQRPEQDREFAGGRNRRFSFASRIGGLFQRRRRRDGSCMRQNNALPQEGAYRS